LICQCNRIFLPRSDGGKPAHVALAHARQLCGLTRTESSRIKALLPIASFRSVARAAIVTRSGEPRGSRACTGCYSHPRDREMSCHAPDQCIFRQGPDSRTAGRGTLAGMLRVANAGNSGKMRNAPGVHVPVVMAAYFRVSLMCGKGGLRSASAGSGDAGWLRSATDTRCRLHVSRYRSRPPSRSSCQAGNDDRCNGRWTGPPAFFNTHWLQVR